MAYKWMKLAPNAFSIEHTDQSIYKHPDLYGDLTMMAGSGQALRAFHSVTFLPDNAIVRLLRIRCGTALPANTQVTATLRRRYYTFGTEAAVCSAVMTAGSTYADSSDPAHTVNNETNQYLVDLYLQQLSGSANIPEVGMVEIKYEI